MERIVPSATNPAVTVELQGHVLHVGLNRPEKRNAFDTEMLDGLADAYGRLEDDPDAWVGVLFAHGDHFTGGLDLAQAAGRIVGGGPRYNSPVAIDPWGVSGRQRSKPIVAAAQGWCMTLGIELLLAADIRIAATDTRFRQMEVLRGIYPFGGATLRFPALCGWGDAMRWMLTGDEFDAAEALRMGLVQETVAAGTQLDRAVELAERIASRSAPLGVRTTITAARRAMIDPVLAAEKLVEDVGALLQTRDASEGVASFLERRPAVFTGH